MITGEQIRAARAMARLEQSELAAKAGVSVETVKRLERTVGPISANIGTLDAVQRTLEAAGVEFTNGGQPGVRMRKSKELDERQRSEAAKAYAREWTAYCKAHNSVAFASASGDLILVQYRKAASSEVLNLAALRVLEHGFEMDGKAIGQDEALRGVFEMLDSRRLTDE